MSYWWLPVCIIMGCFTWPVAKWVFVSYYCKTVETPEFMEMDQVKSVRADKCGQIIDLKV